MKIPREELAVGPCGEATEMATRKQRAATVPKTPGNHRYMSQRCGPFSGVCA